MTDSRKPVAPVDSNTRKPSEHERNWEKTQLRPALEKSPERSSEFTTISGHPIARLYTQADLADWDAPRDLGLPANLLIHVGFIHRCTALAFGPCANSRALVPLRTPIAASATSFHRGKT